MIVFPDQNYFNDFISKSNETEQNKSSRILNYGNINLADLSFKYGLNISFSPIFDFNKIKISPEPKFIRKISDNSILNNNFITHQPNNLDKFNYFNQAFNNDSLNIEIKDNLNYDRSIIIETTNIKESLISNINIKIGKNSKAEIIFINNSEDNNEIYFSQNIILNSSQNSDLKLIFFNNLNSKTLSINNKIFESLENSTIYIHEINSGSYFTSSKVHTNLIGKNSKVFQKSFNISNSQSQFDLLNSVCHKSEKSFSNISTKAVLFDNSKVLNRGIIKISQIADNSDGYEKHEFLLLDNNASAFAIPLLEIDNKNVKCSHGTSISNIDEDKLFYLTSRGLSEETAKNEIIKAFFYSENPLINSKLNEMLNFKNGY